MQSLDPKLKVRVQIESSLVHEVNWARSKSGPTASPPATDLDKLLGCFWAADCGQFDTLNGTPCTRCIFRAQAESAYLLVGQAIRP